MLVCPVKAVILKTSKTSQPPCTHLIVLQAADHELGEDDDSGATHAGTTVNHHRGVEALRGVQHGVCVSPDRLDLLQVGCRKEEEGEFVECG